MVIQGPNEIAANFLGSAAGAEEGKALFYRGVDISGGLNMTTGAFTLGGSNVATQISGKQATLSTSISNPTTQAVILDGTVVRSLTRDSTLTMSVSGNSISLGVDDTVMARHTSVASAISGLATFQYVDTAISGLAGDVYTKIETDGLLAPKATTTALTTGLALKQATLSTGSNIYQPYNSTNDA